MRRAVAPPGGAGEDPRRVGSVPLVRTEQIELVDHRGVMRAWLGPLDDGAVVLAMRDQTGAIRVVLLADATDTSVVLSDGHGRVIWQVP
jgi:hypothetical protein